MTTLYIHTRANGFRWTCVDTATCKRCAREAIARLQAQDDPLWAKADYLISDSRNPLADTEPTVRGTWE